MIGQDDEYRGFRLVELTEDKDWICMTTSVVFSILRLKGQVV